MITKFLCFSPVNRYAPALCRWVNIDSKGFIDGETPVEDFGMFLLLDSPIASESADRLFSALIAYREGENAVSLNSEEAELFSTLTA
jgi:hypothetical protein